MITHRLAALHIKAAPWLAASFLLTVLLLLMPHSAHAATITVDGTTCTLPTAIQAVNSNTAIGGCTAGSGNSDTLLLTAPLYSLSAVSSSVNGDNATPSITSNIVISGGVNGAIVERSGDTLMRIFHVAQTGDLTLTRVTVQKGSAQNGGAIYNYRGKVTLLESKIIANTATNNGGGIYNEFLGSRVTVVDSQIIANAAANNGGGIFNHTNSAITVTGSRVISNTATKNGGGIYAEVYTAATLSGSEISDNTATNSGGGIYVSFTQAVLTDLKIHGNKAANEGGGVKSMDGQITLTNVQVISNTAEFGGGIDIISTATLINVQVISNTAEFGGGIDNSGDATLTNVQVRGNTATVDGGGIYQMEYLSTLILNDSQVISNSATNEGGGIFNTFFGTITLNTSQVSGNTAATGGGIVNALDSTLTLTGSQVSGNTATVRGGGIDNSGRVTLTNVQLTANTATTGNGSAFYNNSGQTTINQSCIANNYDTAVSSAGGDALVATDNWWGASDGPSGVGPGAGDSVGSNVTFAPFSATPFLDCPSRPAQVNFNMSASPSGTLLPGQPLTFTLTFTNMGNSPVRRLFISDSLPAQFIVSQVTSTASVISVSAGTFVITELIPSQVATIVFAGIVNPMLGADTTLTNEATLTHAIAGALNADAAVQVTVPQLNFPSDSFSADEGSGSLPLTVNLTPPNPYFPVTVEVVYNDSVEIASAAVQVINFPPGSSSQEVLIPIVDDEGVRARSILLQLQSPAGAGLGTGSSATITLNENDFAGLIVDKGVNVTQATVGDTLTYSYRITNTGNVPLTISAFDDKLGAVSGLTNDGPLPASGTRSATLNYLVSAADLANEALFTTIVVTGTDALGAELRVTANASVQLEGSSVPPTDTPPTDTPPTDTPPTDTPPTDTPPTDTPPTDTPPTDTPPTDTPPTDTPPTDTPPTDTPPTNTPPTNTPPTEKNATMQVSYVVSPSHARVGEVVSYTYQITNSGSVMLTSVVATDGALAGAAATLADLAPNAFVTGVFSEIIVMEQWPGPVQRTLVVTATNAEDATVTLTGEASATLTLRQTQISIPLILSND